MKPRLIAIAGPLAGSTFPVGPAPLTLGRLPESGLQLRDPAVSRQHCTITVDGERCLLRDLDSRRGTFVNGVPVRERALASGDLINIGSSLFLFRDEEQATAATPAIGGLVDESDYVAASTIHWPLGSPLDLSARAERDLAALLQAAEDLHARRSTETLARRLLELVFTVSPAERAAVLLLDSAGEPETAFAGDRSGEAEPFPVSRTLLSRVTGERLALLAADVVHTPRLGAAASVLADRLSSLLAIPLDAAGTILGVLYADTRDDAARFDPGHLEVLAAACRMAGLALDTVRRFEWQEAERRRLEAAFEHDLVGESPRMQEVYRLLARAAPTPSTVLLGGESGTGKELAARTLHDRSPRAGRPFVAINCATLSDTLLESELFGHEKGAFTGAVERKTGKLEVAHSGTVFLDEVAEIPPGLQAKLLRFLEEREFERVGGTRPIKVDVRVVAATHRDLEQAIRDGAFRADLYYRLAVIRLTLPALRERREDIPLLASHFAARFSRELGRPVAGFSPEARACLERYSWPGNVRELRNAVERAVALGEGEMIIPADLPETVLETAAGAGKAEAAGLPPFHAAVNELKKNLILNAVREARGNISAAARALGLHPNYLHRLITNLELRVAL